MKVIIVLALIFVGCGSSNNDNNANNMNNVNNQTNNANNQSNNANNQSNNVNNVNNQNNLTGAFTATATYEGADLTFACDTFEAGDGNIKMYIGQIDSYALQCRSSDGTTQIKLGFAAPAVGTTDYDVAQTGVTIGGINEIDPLGAEDSNAVTNQITFATVEMGAALSGTFTAEWDATDGGRVATLSGQFDVTF